MQTQFNIYLVVLAITFIYGLVSYSRLTNPFKLLFLLITYVLVSETIIRFALPKLVTNVTPAYHITVLVLIVLYSRIFFKLFEGDKTLQKITLGSTLILGTLALINSFFYQGLRTFPSLGISAQGLLCILLSLLLFKKMLDTPSKTMLSKQPLFWFNLGTFSFYSFNFISFIFYNEFEFEEMTYWIFYLNVIGNWILYLFYLQSLYLNQKSH